MATTKTTFFDGSTRVTANRNSRTASLPIRAAATVRLQQGHKSKKIEMELESTWRCPDQGHEDGSRHWDWRRRACSASQHN